MRIQNKIVLLLILLGLNSIGFSQTATDYYNKGLAEFSYGNLTAALDNMNKAIQLKPDYANALSYRGYFYEQTQKYDLAISDYVAADKLSKNINGYLIANPFAMLGRTAEAFSYLEAALNSADGKPILSQIIDDPELASLHSDPKWKELTNKNWYTEYELLIQKTNSFAETGDAKGAIETLDKAIKLDPKRTEAFTFRSIIYFKTGELEKALADQTEAIRIDPTNASLYKDRAFIYKELKRPKDALTDFDKAIELDPETMAYGDRAMILFSLNQSDKRVESDLKMYLNSFYQDDFNWFLLGTYYYGIKNYSSSVEALSKAIQINSKTEDYFIKRAQSYFELKQNDDAISDLNKAISINPNDCNAFYIRGTVKAEKLDKSGACQDWKKAMSLGCDDVNGYVRTFCN